MRRVTSPASGAEFDFIVKDDGSVTIRMDGELVSKNERIENVIANYADHGCPAAGLMVDHAAKRALNNRIK